MLVAPAAVVNVPLPAGMFMNAVAPVSPLEMLWFGLICTWLTLVRAVVADRVAGLRERLGGAGVAGEQVVAVAVGAVGDADQLLQQLLQLGRDVLALRRASARNCWPAPPGRARSA